MTGVLVVGYRRSALAGPGVFAMLLTLAAACAGFLAFGSGMGAVVAAVAFVVCAFATLLIVPLYLRAVVRALRGAPPAHPGR